VTEHLHEALNLRPSVQAPVLPKIIIINKTKLQKKKEIRIRA
jgi:hypothetical protein